MRKLTLAVAALALFVASGISRAADQPTSGQPGMAPMNPEATIAAQTGSIQMPPSDWTNLNGTVQAVDTSAKTVQIQDQNGTLLQVNVNKEVNIRKDGKDVKLSQVQAGDTITLAKKMSSNPGAPKAY